MIKKNKQRVTIFLDPSLVKHAKMQAIAEDISLTALLERALSRYLPKERYFPDAKTKRKK